MHRYVKILTFAAITIFAMSLLAVSCAYSEETCRIYFVQGGPTINRAGASDWVACEKGMVVGTGDRIKTLAGEVVEVSFEKKDSNIVRISENSDVLLKKTDAPYSIELLNGEAMALLKKLPANSTFEIRTPAGLSGARGTGWGSQTDGRRSIFRSFLNSIYTRGIDSSGNPMAGELIVDSGFRTLVDMFQDPSGLESLSPEEWAAWRQWMDELERRGGSLSERFARIENMAGNIDDFSDKKQDTNEARDAERLDDRLNRPSSCTSQGPKGGDPY